MRQSNDLKRLRVSATWVDSRGRACPLPIVDVASALKRGALEVELWADDPATLPDLQAFCAATRHHLVVADENGAGGCLRAVVKARVDP